MKRLFKYLIKCIIAGVISIVILSLFSLVYYNPPIVATQPDGTTNYRFVPNSNWSFMWEGVGYGKTDASGYNNAYYDECNNPDIVIMGSSHMEALQVPQNANCVYLLNEKTDKKCLNLGISGHSFEVLVNNYKYVLEKYNNAEAIIMETSNVEFSPAVLDDIIAGKYHQPMEEKGFVADAAQRVPFIRHMYKKINEVFTKKTDISAPSADFVDNSNDMTIYTEKMNIILSEISKISSEKNIKPIILLHSSFWKDDNGNIVTEMNEEYKNAFIKCCEANRIKVVDVVPEMISAYKEKYEFSYGFSNTAPGKGHLNKTGHRIIADALYEEIIRMGENK